MLSALSLLGAEEALAWILESGVEVCLVLTVWVILSVVHLLEGKDLIARHVRIVTPPLVVILLDAKLRVRLACG